VPTPATASQDSTQSAHHHHPPRSVSANAMTTNPDGGGGGASRCCCHCSDSTLAARPANVVDDGSATRRWPRTMQAAAARAIEGGVPYSYPRIP
jgi:hypothetical protein